MNLLMSMGFTSQVHVILAYLPNHIMSKTSALVAIGYM